MTYPQRFRIQLNIVIAATIVVSACSVTSNEEGAQKSSMKDLVFLTRQGCVNTVTMRTNLDEALRALGLPADYQFIDADTLQPSDARGGYGTPTVLFKGGDIFGLEEPPVPHPPPT